MILSPPFAFGLALATFYGLLTHLVTGGDLRILAIYVTSSWVGFGIGQSVGQIMGITVLAVGQIYPLPATFGSLIALITAAILSARRLPPGRAQ